MRGAEGGAGPGLCRGGWGVEDHVVVDLVLAALVPAAGEAGDALRFVIAGEVDLGAEEALGLGAGAEVERVGYVDGEVGLL